MPTFFRSVDRWRQEWRKKEVNHSKIAILVKKKNIKLNSNPLPTQHYGNFDFNTEIDH